MRVVFRFAVFLLACVAAYFLLLQAKSIKRPSVILIVLDTLRADHLGIYGYERDTSPVLDAFASESLFTAYAITPAPWTPPAIASMFTGLYSSGHGMMPPNGRELAIKSSSVLDEKNETLAEILLRNGYQTVGITPNPWTKSEFGFDQGFEKYYFRERARAEEINRAAFKVLDTLDSARPFFLFLHYLDPHGPYDAPEGYSEKYHGGLKARSYTDEVLKDLNLYDGEIRYLDTYLGKLFENLKERGIWDETLIVIVGDHGEQFEEHGHIGHGFQLYDEEVHVPLFVKTGRPPKRIEQTVSSLDILPTIMELVDIESPASIHGVSLLNEEGIKGRAGVLSEINRRFNWKAFTDQSMRRLVLDYGDDSENDGHSGPIVLGLIDGARDPYSLNATSDENLIQSLKGEFGSQYARVIKDRVITEMVQIKDSTLDELRSLGYIK